MGITGIIRASTWEDAYGIAEDEMFPEASETWEEIAKDLECSPDELMDNACFQEAYGFRPNGANAKDKIRHGIYVKDLNGDHLDTLTDELIRDLELRFLYHPHITTTFEVVTEESASVGEASEQGFEDEDGRSMVPDSWDKKEGRNHVKNAIEFLRDKGACQYSSYPFSPGGWYSTEPEQDMRDGSWTTYSFHLHGFTDAELQTIHTAIMKG